MRFRRICTLAGVAAAALLSASPTAVLAQGAQASSPAELGRLAEQLKPGEWVWAPTIAPTGPLLIYVDLSRQLATVYRNGVRIAISTVSSGKEGHETPTGVFQILQKNVLHKSSLYKAGGNQAAPMPYSERLTWDGIALHAGGLPGYPESHGCIHLPLRFSQALFGITALGATVVIQGSAVAHVRTSEASLLAPLTTKGASAVQAKLDQAPFTWAPEKATAGPLTIIISKHDQAIVVLRNGVEIGRSIADISDDDPGSHVISLTTAPSGTRRWVYVGLPGHNEDAGRQLDEATINRVHLPRIFYRHLQAALKPGTTILVTQSSVGEGEPAHRMTLMDSVTPEL